MESLRNVVFFLLLMTSLRCWTNSMAAPWSRESTDSSQCWMEPMVAPLPYQYNDPIKVSAARAVPSQSAIANCLPAVQYWVRIYSLKTSSGVEFVRRLVNTDVLEQCWTGYEQQSWQGLKNIKACAEATEAAGLNSFTFEVDNCIAYQGWLSETRRDHPSATVVYSVKIPLTDFTPTPPAVVSAGLVYLQEGVLVASWTVFDICLERRAYRVSWGDDTKLVNKFDSDLTIEGLDICLGYEVTVVAVDEDQQEYGTSVTETIMSAYVPYVTSVDLDYASDGNLTISWTGSVVCPSGFHITWTGGDATVAGGSSYTTLSMDVCQPQTVVVVPVDEDFNEFGDSATNSIGRSYAPSMETLDLSYQEGGNLDASWTVTDICNCVDDFRVSWGSGDEFAFTEKRDYTILDLDICLGYNVTVVAVGDGDGDNGAPINKWIKRNYAPDIVSVDLAYTDGGELIANWTLSDTCDSVEGFHVTWNEDGNLVVNDADARQITISNDVCEHYSVTVVSLDEDLLDYGGAASSSIERLYVPGIVSLDLSYSTESVLTVRWYITDLCSVGQGYRVTWDTGTETVESTENHYDIERIDICQEYSVTVVFLDDDGNNYGAPVTETILQYHVPYVTSVDLDYTSDGNLTISWIGSNVCPSGFHITWTGGDDTVAGGSSYTTLSMDVCQPQTVVVVPVDEDGNDFGNSATNSIGRSYDEIPQISASANRLLPHSISVRWTLSGDVCDDVARYRVYCTQDRTDGSFISVPSFTSSATGGVSLGKKLSCNTTVNCDIEMLDSDSNRLGDVAFATSEPSAVMDMGVFGDEVCLVALTDRDRNPEGCYSTCRRLYLPMFASTRENFLRDRQYLSLFSYSSDTPVMAGIEYIGDAWVFIGDLVSASQEDAELWLGGSAPAAGNSPYNSCTATVPTDNHLIDALSCYHKTVCICSTPV